MKNGIILKIQPTGRNKPVAALMAAIPLLAVCFLVRVQAAPGDLDPTFGAGGRVTTNILDGLDGASAVAIQADGKIIVAGTASDTGGIGENFALVRYNSDGSLDATFGAGGIVVTNFSSDSLTVDVAIQADGKIVAVGRVLSVGGNSDFGIVRYEPNGSLDPTFGAGGRVTTDFFGDFDGAISVAIQKNDGKIVVAGIAKSAGVPSDFALARYETNGALDLTFGTGGKVTADFFGEADRAGDVGVQSDGKIVVAGVANFGGTDDNFGVARFDTSGNLDPTFGSGGKATTDLGGNDECNALAIQSDGKIVAAGRAKSTGFASDFGIIRYDTSGNLDPTFGSGGKVTTDFFGFGDSANDIKVQPDGKIVAVGLVNPVGASLDFGIARYNPDGALDATFGSGGKTTTSFTGSDVARGVAVQTDCKIVTAGFSNPPNTSDSLFAVARFDGGGCASAPPVCPKGHGYWKNHSDSWPVDSLMLGNQTYNQPELLALLGSPTKGDASIILARQLIAAKFNLASGSDPSPISNTVAHADNLLSAFSGKLPYKVKPSSTAGQAMTTDADILDNYNNGLLTPNCVP